MKMKKPNNSWKSSKNKQLIISIITTKMKDMNTIMILMIITTMDIIMVMVIITGIITEVVEVDGNIMNSSDKIQS